MAKGPRGEGGLLKGVRRVQGGRLHRRQEAFVAKFAEQRPQEFVAGRALGKQVVPRPYVPARGQRHAGSLEARENRFVQPHHRLADAMKATRLHQSCRQRFPMGFGQRVEVDGQVAVCGGLQGRTHVFAWDGDGATPADTNESARPFPQVAGRKP